MAVAETYEYTDDYCGARETQVVQRTPRGWVAVAGAFSVGAEATESVIETGEFHFHTLACFKSWMEEKIIPELAGANVA